MYQATDATSRAMLRLSRALTWAGHVLLSAILLSAALPHRRERSGS